MEKHFSKFFIVARVKAATQVGRNLLNIHGSTHDFYQCQEKTEVWGDKRGQDNLMMRWWENFFAKMFLSSLIDHQLLGRSNHGYPSAHRRSKGTVWPIFKQLQGCKAAINHNYTAGTAGGAHVEEGSVLSLQSAERSAADVKDIGSQISGEQHGVWKIKRHSAGHGKARASQGQNDPHGHESRRWNGEMEERYLLNGLT